MSGFRIWVPLPAMFVSNGAPNEAMARCSTAPSAGCVTADYRTEGWRPVTFDAMWRAAVEAGPGALFLRFENSHGEVNEWMPVPSSNSSSAHV